jgi:hypothetical protein
MSIQGKRETASRILLESRLAYHLRCLREDATNPDLTAVERLTLVRGRAVRMREIERELEAMKGTITKRWPNIPR